MDPSFFRSRAFAITGTLALLVLVGGAAAYRYGGIAYSTTDHGGCDAPALDGAALQSEPQTVVENDGRRRVVTYRLDAAAFAGGATRLCSPHGEVVIEPAPADEAEIEFVITSQFASAVERTAVAGAFRGAGGALQVGAWVERIGASEGAFDADSAHVRVIVRLPASGAWALQAHSDTGDLRASGLLAADLDLATSLGDIVVTDMDLTGDATLRTSTGDVILALASVQSGNITLSSELGNAEAELPERADIGYEVFGASNLGDVTIRIGPTESYDSRGEGIGEEESARSAGFASKPTKVHVDARSSTGDIRIATTSTA